MLPEDDPEPRADRVTDVVFIAEGETRAEFEVEAETVTDEEAEGEAEPEADDEGAGLEDCTTE